MWQTFVQFPLWSNRLWVRMDIYGEDPLLETLLCAQGVKKRHFQRKENMVNSTKVPSRVNLDMVL